MARPPDAEIIKDVENNIKTLGKPRCAAIQKQLDMNGLAYYDPATRDAYVAELYCENIFPYVDGAYQMSATQIQQAYAAAAVQSSCGIVAECSLRVITVDDPRMYMFYPDRVAKGIYVIGLENSIAQANGAWVSGTPWVEGSPLPRAADEITIGIDGDSSWARGNTISLTHAMTAVSWLDGYLHTIDGGQDSKFGGSSQAVALRTRFMCEVWTGENSQGQRTGELWVGAVDANGDTPITSDGRPVTGRRVVGFIDVSKMPLRGPVPSCGAGAAVDPLYGDEGGTGGAEEGLDLVELTLAGLGALALGAGAILTGRAAVQAFERYQRRRAA